MRIEDEASEQLVPSSTPLESTQPQVVQYLPLPSDYTSLTASERTTALRATLDSIAVGIHVLFTIIQPALEEREKKSESRIITP